MMVGRRPTRVKDALPKHPTFSGQSSLMLTLHNNVNEEFAIASYMLDEMTSLPLRRILSQYPSPTLRRGTYFVGNPTPSASRPSENVTCSGFRKA